MLETVPSSVISVTILTKNSERHIREVLDSLKDFEEVIILDTGSTDSTVAIAGNFSNVKIFFSEFVGFGALHNEAAALAGNIWILSLDSDEIMTEELADELLTMELNENCVYSFNFRNYYNGKFIKCCGWYPDRHVRIYNRRITRFSDSLVHEGIERNGLKEIRLKGHVNHYSYSSIEDFLSKMQTYSTLFASHYRNKKKSSPLKAVLHSVFAFLKSYVLNRGFLHGYEGFVISAYNANTTLYKYLKLYEAGQGKEK
jgi:glycosyltransferase involved in cell wall biosynthesis